MGVVLVGHGIDNIGTRGIEGGRHGGVADRCWTALYEADLEVVVAPCRKVGDECQQEFSKVLKTPTDSLSLA